MFSEVVFTEGDLEWWVWNPIGMHTNNMGYQPTCSHLQELLPEQQQVAAMALSYF